MSLPTRQGPELTRPGTGSFRHGHRGPGRHRRSGRHPPARRPGAPPGYAGPVRQEKLTRSCRRSPPTASTTASGCACRSSATATAATPRSSTSTSTPAASSSYKPPSRSRCQSVGSCQRARGARLHRPQQRIDAIHHPWLRDLRPPPTTDNVTYTNLVNIKQVAHPQADVLPRSSQTAAGLPPPAHRAQINPFCQAVADKGGQAKPAPIGG